MKGWLLGLVWVIFSCTYLLSQPPDRAQPWQITLGAGPTSCLDIGTGRSSGRTHWSLWSDRWWSRDCTCPTGSTEAIMTSLSSADAVLGDGTWPRPSLSCMRVGYSLGLLIGFWFFGQFLDLMKSLARTCCQYSVLDRTPAWKLWTRLPAAGCTESPMLVAAHRDICRSLSTSRTSSACSSLAGD